MEEEVPSLRHTKEAIAAYVAFVRRVHLYAHLDTLDRALYCVTDSVIFVQNDGETPLVQCGDSMGDMTSQMKENEYISEFVSGGT